MRDSRVGDRQPPPGRESLPRPSVPRRAPTHDVELEIGRHQSVGPQVGDRRPGLKPDPAPRLPDAQAEVRVLADGAQVLVEPAQRRQRLAADEDRVELHELRRPTDERRPDVGHPRTEMRLPLDEPPRARLPLDPRLAPGQMDLVQRATVPADRAAPPPTPTSRPRSPPAPRATPAPPARRCPRRRRTACARAPPRGCAPGSARGTPRSATASRPAAPRAGGRAGAARRAASPRRSGRSARPARCARAPTRAIASPRSTAPAGSPRRSPAPRAPRPPPPPGRTADRVDPAGR